jgi:hypothetical protein
LCLSVSNEVGGEKDPPLIDTWAQAVLDDHSINSGPAGDR